VLDSGASSSSVCDEAVEGVPMLRGRRAAHFRS